MAAIAIDVAIAIAKAMITLLPLFVTFSLCSILAATVILLIYELGHVTLLPPVASYLTQNKVQTTYSGS